MNGKEPKSKSESSRGRGVRQTEATNQKLTVMIASRDDGNKVDE